MYGIGRFVGVQEPGIARRIEGRSILWYERNLIAATDGGATRDSALVRTYDEIKLRQINGRGAPADSTDEDR